MKMRKTSESANSSKSDTATTTTSLATISAVLVLLFGLSLIACHKERPNTPPTGDNRARMNPITPPQSRIGTATNSRTTVELLEYEIRMPDTLPAGTNVLHVVNSGMVNHSLAIEGSGVKAELFDKLTRGDSTPFTVDLKPGTYTVYCPVVGHKGKGMTKTITVK
jgi:hypothetical protein